MARYDHRRTGMLTATLVVMLVLLRLQLVPGTATQSTTPDADALHAAYATLPLAFEPNVGQADESVDFLVHHGQAVTAFSSTGTTTSVGGKQVTMSLTGAAEQQFAGTDELQSKTNYFLGNDQSKWQSDVPNYGKLLAKDVYPGIDLAYYGTNSQLEHDFIVSPGANYKQIAFGFTGQDDLSLDGNGNLILKAGDDTLTLNAPVTYQTGEHEKHTIPSSFELNDGTVTVAVADTYDPAKPLVIDPALVYATYLGGNGIDQGNAITLDVNGNAYIVGQTQSTDFATVAPAQGSNAGNTDAFVVKLNREGSALVYATYLGGSNNDYGRAIRLDLYGGIYLAGFTTSTDFPVQSPYQSSFGGGGGDVFVTQLNYDGSGLQFSSYFGGNGSDNVSYQGMALNPQGSIYIVGQTTSTDLPTASPIQAALSGPSDMFIAKLSPWAASLDYGTYLGGSSSDGSTINGITVDDIGNAYIVGDTLSTDFPTATPYQAANAGGTDAVMAKINSTGTALTYATYLGGSAADHATAITLDTDKNIYVTGYTSSTDFPTAAPIQAGNGGGSDAFVAKFNAAGSALTYSTYLGGSAGETAYAIALDADENAYVAGETFSTNFPTVLPFQASNGGAQDVFVTKVSAAGSAFEYSTYLGGGGTDQGFGLAVSLAGNAYVTGGTGSVDLPTAVPLQGTKAASTDAFVAQLTEDSVTVTGEVETIINVSFDFTVDAASCGLGVLSASETKACTHTITAGTNGAGGYVISYLPTTTLTNGGNTITAMASQATSMLGSKQFGFNLVANTAAGSHTAADFGAAPSGGTGAAMSGYQTANQFKFAVGGDSIAQAPGVSSLTTYTVSYIANMSPDTTAGAYATTITYNVTAHY